MYLVEMNEVVMLPWGWVLIVHDLLQEGGGRRGGEFPHYSSSTRTRVPAPSTGKLPVSQSCTPDLRPSIADLPAHAPPGFNLCCMASHVVVLDSSARRTVVKTTPTKHLADVLQEACSKLGLDASQHGLR